jgi:hypothetical protein
MKWVKLAARLLVAGFVACSSLLWAIPASATTATLYEHLNTGADMVYQVRGAQIVAQIFTTQTSSHTVTYFRCLIQRVGAPGSVVVELEGLDGSGNPQSPVLATQMLDGNILSTSLLWIQFSVNTTSLIGGTQYALVMSVPSGGVSDYIAWAAVSTGGGFTGGNGLYSTDNGASWTSTGVPNLQFEVWGNPCLQINSALAYNNYIEQGDMLFIMEYQNTYPPYYGSPTFTGSTSVITGSKDPRLYFDLRLLDTAGTTVFASTPMTQWGLMPGSIYLNANQAAALTSGAQYYLQVYGTFTGNPNVLYQLQVSDWKGDINGYVLAVASDMESYYQVALTTNLPSYGLVLNDTANVKFTTGIPYLIIAHPELFATVIQSPSFHPPATPTITSTATWQNQVGPNIAGVFTDIGTMFGVNAQYVGTAIIFLMYFALIMSVGSRGGTPMVAAGIGFPVLGLGLFLVLVDWVFVATIILIAALFTLIGFWVTRT